MSGKINVSYEFVKLNKEEMAELKHNRISNAKSTEIAKAIMASKVKNGAISVSELVLAKGRSLAGTVNSVLKKYESESRVRYAQTPDKKKAYLIIEPKKVNTDAEAEADADDDAEDDTDKKE